MKICYDKAHGEIVHAGQDCLACQTIYDLIAEIEGLKCELKEAQRAMRDELKK